MMSFLKDATAFCTGLLIATCIAAIVVPLYIIFVAICGMLFGSTGIAFGALGGLALMFLPWCKVNS